MNLRPLTVSCITNYLGVKKDFSTYPVIRLQGKWLEKLGFNIGDKVHVIEEKEQLIIKIKKD
ncbi:SymE family type I addiction module toxin [Vallitalea sp.]|jgi:formylmethanofuran dehydrogenase subunit D|uniref:SymE family type I addiction module toxin n=1 Tax=Vallitalea sp. TaxID=1882829 RepID=UPI0025F6FAED|nr:SymE family type I addiction module toxin [Vallitalea sp.]MCT4687468.1 type I toxin-antitoxin system SymE family toxin [Vallitalea sp.]